MNDKRRDPELLLKRAAAEGAGRRRGRLKVFFGAAPGVGKTYAMLEAARAKQVAGVDVVIGWVETHGRSDTAALAEGLARMPPRETSYRGVTLRDFDLDAALVRRPQLLIVDELAHTNVPGSRHAKRWQDVQELLDASIDVYTTLNVQHLESLKDLVGQITGVTVRETVPDQVLDAAAEVEFVDLAPEDLLRRLEEGKVYLPEAAARAAQDFFRKGNLIALRELALRRTAERVDVDMQDYRRDHDIRRTWPVAERILVCVRPNSDSERLVRAARRMATGLRAEWIVVYVETPSQPALSSEDRKALGATMKLAERLGATTAVLSGESVGAALMECARERNASKIVVGKPRHSYWRDRMHGSLLEEVVRSSGEIDVYVISGDVDQDPASEQPVARPPARRAAYVRSTAVVILCSLICLAMVGRFDRSNLIMVYLLGVAVVATRDGRGPSIWAACLSVAIFDFFFVPPYLTFAVSDSQYIITFAIMLIVSLLISSLAIRVRDQAEAARQRERRVQALYAMSRDLTGRGTPGDVRGVTCHHVGELFHGSAVVLLPDASARLVIQPGNDVASPNDHEMSVAQWVFEHGQNAGQGTDTLPGAAALYIPLLSAGRVEGVLGLRPDPALLPLSPDQMDLVETLCRQAAGALEHSRLSAENEQARVTAEREQLRSTLLSSLSHDVRTPLTTIMGAATSLLQQPRLTESVRDELTASIHDEAQRLNRLALNVLDLTSLESSSVPLRKEWYSVEEIVGSALTRLDGLLGERRVETRLPADLPLVPLDPILIEQVLVNLLENAVKYTPLGSPVLIEARGEAAQVVIEVADEGPGLRRGDEERVFDKFHRGPSGERGFGLGLAICRAILTAHGGRIEAQNREGGGAVFRFHLPIEGTPPPLPSPESL